MTIVPVAAMLPAELVGLVELVVPAELVVLVELLLLAELVVLVELLLLAELVVPAELLLLAELVVPVMPIRSAPPMSSVAASLVAASSASFPFAWSVYRPFAPSLLL